MFNDQWSLNIKHRASTNSEKIVTPVKTGVQRICGVPKNLDSGFRRNDGVFFAVHCLLLTPYCILALFSGFPRSRRFSGFHFPRNRS